MQCALDGLEWYLETEPFITREELDIHNAFVSLVGGGGYAVIVPVKRQYVDMYMGEQKTRIGGHIGVVVDGELSIVLEAFGTYSSTVTVCGCKEERLAEQEMIRIKGG